MAAGMFQVLAAYVRKEHKDKRFDRERAAEPLQKKLLAYWKEGIDGLFAYMSKNGRWEKLQDAIRLRHHIDTQASKQYPVITGFVRLHKALSDEDRSLLIDLLSGFHLYSDADRQAQVLIEATSFDTFEQAATFALQQLGLKAPDFKLDNPQIKEKLLARTDAAIFATKNNVDGIFSTIVNHFYDLGQNPYDHSFLQDLKSALNEDLDWKAKRFALTETGIAAELAQAETYKRNGVTAKEWNITGDNTRPDHIELEGTVIGIHEKFDVGGSPGDHPLDPSLPADQIVNCHCWLSPVVDDDYELDPNNIWEGQ